MTSGGAKVMLVDYVPLSGNNSIIGRSLKIHDMSGVTYCANITEADPNPF